MFIFVALFSITLILLQFGINYKKFIIVEGDSMYPTVKNHSLAFLSQNSEIKNGDIVVFQFNDEILIKRVIYSFKDNLRYSEEGKVGDDNYPELFTPYDPNRFSKIYQALQKYSKIPKMETLKKDQFWVDGDNFGHTLSSANIGPINKSDVIGTLTYTIGPDGFKKY